MLLAVYFAAALLILLRGLFVAINRMGRHTAPATRAAWLLLTTGAVDIVVGPLFGRVPAPTYGDALLLAALAWYVLWRDGVMADEKGERS
jgi:uncharacterized membrane protein HdeD (DUF308 family)